MELTDYIAEDLRGSIQSAEGLPCKLTLPALATHYSVSLTPVRTAIARLLDEGWLEKLPNGRLVVARRLPRRRAPRRAQPVNPPPTARDRDLVLVREVMLASLRSEPVNLREEALAERHGMGRSMIRQSLGRLAGAGLIEHIPRRGWLVRPIEEDDLAAYLEVREVLELKALDLARPRLEPADLQSILEGNAPVPRGRPPQQDNRLHEYLIVKSGNRYIQNFFRHYTATYYTSAFEYAAPEAHVVARMAQQHRQILKAIMARKWAVAREALAQHIRGQRPILSRLLQKMAASGSAQ